MNRNLLSSRAFYLRSHCQDIQFSSITHMDELIYSSRLLHTNYMNKDYISKKCGNLLYLPYYFYKKNILFTAKYHQKIIGTIGVLNHNLPVYKDFKEQIENLNIHLDEAVEISSFSIDQQYQNKNLFSDLYSHALFHILFKLKAKHIFIQVDAKKTAFYKKLFFNQVCVKKHQKYNDVEAALLHLDFHAVWQKLKKLHQNQLSKNHSNLIALLKDFDVYDHYKMLKKLKISDAQFQWSEEELDHYKSLCGIMN